MTNFENMATLLFLAAVAALYTIVLNAHWINKEVHKYIVKHWDDLTEAQKDHIINLIKRYTEDNKK